jgi:hypothetical protein
MTIRRAETRGQCSPSQKNEFFFFGVSLLANRAGLPIDSRRRARLALQLFVTIPRRAKRLSLPSTLRFPGSAVDEMADRLPQT